MVHESLRVYITPDTYTLVPVYLDPSSPTRSLVINRDTGSFVLNHNGTDSVPLLTTLTVYGIFGVIRLLAGEYLIAITERERVGRLGGHDIFQARQYSLTPIAKDFRHLTESEADDRFFWNRHLQSKLVDITLNNPDQDLSDFILPVVFGFVSIHQTSIKSRPTNFALISRRSRFRNGTRFFSRGVDRDGNASNYVETEQIVEVDPLEDRYEFEGKVKLSYVQTRGSIPIYWAQINNIKYTPKLIIMELPDTFICEDIFSLQAARRHFDEQSKYYGKTIVVNLVNKRGYEFPICEAFKNTVYRLGDPRLSYYYFDFHHECRNMRWDRIQILIDQIENELLQQGYFHAEGSQICKTQTSVVRTNCMDCLDRTNVVQSTIAKWVLTQQLRAIGVLSNKERIDEVLEFMHLFRNTWADNADVVSLAYSGTGALKTDFTRTGKRTKEGMLQDFQNSVSRYITNNFLDGSRQDAYDLLTGNYEVKFRAMSPFVDQRAVHIRLAPQVLSVSTILILLIFLIPHSPEYVTLIRLVTFAFLAVIVFLVRFIVNNGSEYVGWPSLVPREYRYFRTPATKNWGMSQTELSNGEKFD
ncbi:2260_t:CDS:10 [Paraglomus brasilianum]|uniref:2260_t:CDS:1 n=1 Tax=Paraglomus brasilianum TaxID=144538 RepID=A0A9N9AXP5_9GLOM|nr:2260_t:CDS:10 [Paraglomus brasilianum]